MGILVIQIKEKIQSSAIDLAKAENNHLPDIKEKSNFQPLERTYFSANSLSERPVVLRDIDENLLQNFGDVEFKKLELTCQKSERKHIAITMLKSVLEK